MTAAFQLGLPPHAPVDGIEYWGASDLAFGALYAADLLAAGFVDDPIMEHFDLAEFSRWCTRS